jgi:hypothetical protein
LRIAHARGDWHFFPNAFFQIKAHAEGGATKFFARFSRLEPFKEKGFFKLSPLIVEILKKEKNAGYMVAFNDALPSLRDTCEICQVSSSSEL